MVRPSYVLGGRAMEIVYSDADLKRYIQNAVEARHITPIHTSPDCHGVCLSRRRISTVDGTQYRAHCSILVRIVSVVIWDFLLLQHSCTWQG